MDTVMLCEPLTLYSRQYEEVTASAVMMFGYPVNTLLISHSYHVQTGDYNFFKAFFVENDVPYSHYTIHIELNVLLKNYDQMDIVVVIDCELPCKTCRYMRGVRGKSCAFIHEFVVWYYYG